MNSVEQNSRKKKSLYIILLCFCGLLINILGVRLALGLDLPLYLDNIGSALSAALGGSIPGIIVGFFTNLINGIADATTTYYGVLTVLIAILSAFFAKKGFYSFRKPWRLLVVIVVFALIGGGLGSVLTWTIFGFEFGTGISAPLAQQIYGAGNLSPYLSQLAADMIIDLADKAVTVLIVAAVYNLIPEKVKNCLYLTGWMQNPISDKNAAELEHRRNRGASLRSKIIVLVTLAMVITGTVVMAISYYHFRDAAVKEQVNMANGILNVVAEVIDGDRVDEYIEKGESAQGYLEIESHLSNLMNSAEEIEFVYVYKIMEDGCHVVFDPDPDVQTGADPGDIVPFDEAFSDYLPALLAGEEIEPVISDETYGWLLTIYKPIHDSSGVTQCYGAVDINMDQIAISGYMFLARGISLFLGVLFLILTLAIWLAEYNIVMPINTMDAATGRFAYDTVEARADTVESIKNLNIHTGDEIENLYHSVVKTTEETVRYIAFSQSQSETISKLQNGLILVLADMVESRDECTGDHVRKTAEYAAITMRQMQKEGIYADQLTDEFIYEVKSYAPLHDIGKISVSDTILNKPGKLTDEEFEIMKTHTTAGAEIIARAIDIVAETDSGYLEEAMNLAHYHHEKWNGTGYPCGLKGEEIPLSARVMAIADVFDALVSKRSYKEGFSFEKAMSIIEEGAGTHFDPLIAKAFMDAGEEVRKTMNTYMGHVIDVRNDQKA